MANSKYDFHKQEEQNTDLKFNRGSYIIIRIDGDKFHQFSTEHKFDKPNDKRALDLMVESAKQLMKTYKGHIPLAYGHSDEFSFLIKSTSNLLSRRIFKLTSMLPVVFATYYNSNWDQFFGNTAQGEITPKKYDAWFDAKPKEYANHRAVIDYFRWRQVDCHINNLYNTTLHAITGRYVKHELVLVDPDELVKSDNIFSNGSGDDKFYELKRTPIRDWITDHSHFMSSQDATQRLTGTISSDKHDILFLQYKINYNNELEQFKKGTVIVDTQQDFTGKNADASSIQHYNVDFTKGASFWEKNRHIFDDISDTLCNK